LSIFTIVIAYYPDKHKLLQLCENLILQNTRVVVVDNTPDNLDLYAFPEKCDYISLGYNSGIAYAQNVGIRFARERNAAVIFFLDQDSTPPSSFISTLTKELPITIPRVVGPVRIDREKHFEYASEILNRIGYPKKIYGRYSKHLIAVDSMISSGTGVTTITFQSVGLMDEDFFIDHVDDEWCLRARKCGVELFIHSGVEMQHSIGKKTQQLAGLTIFVSSAERCYYSMRNAIFLFKKKHIPILFATKNFVSTLIHQLLQLRYVEDKWQYFSLSMLGLFHGIKGVKGPMQK
jgi:rhamnosyltransferase